MKSRLLLLTVTLTFTVALLLAFFTVVKFDETGEAVATSSAPAAVASAQPEDGSDSRSAAAESARLSAAIFADDTLMAEKIRAAQGEPANLSGYSLGHVPPGISRIERVLYQEIAPADDRGLVRRTHVLETDFHFPLLQTVELLGRNPDTGEEEIVAYKSMVADHVLAQLDMDRLPVGWEAHLAEAGISVRRKITGEGLYLLEFPVDEAGKAFHVIDSLKKEHEWVRFAEPDYVIAKQSHDDPIPSDPRFGEMWGLQNTGQFGGMVGQDIKAVDAWGLQAHHPELSGVAGSARDVVVAILDTGVDYRHFDLKPNMWVNPREQRDGLDNSGSGIVDDIYGANMITGTGDPMDFHSHGTHVAGTIGAVGDNNNGISGVAWDVQLMAVSILYPGGTMSDTVRGIDYAWQNGADILNNSWGVVIFNARLFGSWRSEALADAILRTKNAGAIFVTAAGNDFEDVDRFPDFPAHHQEQADNVVNVAALDRNGNLAFFSNYGPNNVQIAAPGHQILSTVPGDGYASFSGTSMAAPHISGMLAILKQEYPNESYRTLIQRLLQRSDKEQRLASYVGIGRRANLARALDPTPLIDEPLEDFEFLPGNDVTLRIGVSSSGGQSTIQWFKDGALLSGQTGSTLALGQATRASGGVYRVEVTNAYGTSVSQALVGERPTHPELGEILGAPELTWTSTVTAPWSVDDTGTVPGARSGSIEHNQRSELATTVVGPGTLRFSWKVSSEQGYDLLTFSIGNEVLQTRSGEGGWLHRTIAIPAGPQKLVWRYTKDGSRSTGDDAGWLANVVYENDAPLIDSQTASLEVVAGSPVTLSLQARGAGTLSYLWRKDGNVVNGQNAPALSFEEVAFADAGSYTATVSNVHGTATTLPINLSVVAEARAPEFLNEPDGFHGPEGGRLTLFASWSGTHPFSLQWYKDGEAVAGETGASLTLPNLTTEDSGEYHLEVTNDAGTAESFPAIVSVHPAFERFASWIARHGGFDAVKDAVSDGVDPLLRFALGLAPEESAAHRLPRLSLVPEPRAGLLNVSSTEPGEGPLHAALVFEIPSFIEGASYILEASQDLVTWEAVEASMELIDLLESGSQLVQLREVSPMTSEQTRRFLRLRVTIAE